MCVSPAGILQVGICIKIYLEAIASVKMNQDIVSEIWKALSYKTEYLRSEDFITVSFLQAAFIIWPFLGQTSKVTLS